MKKVFCFLVFLSLLTLGVHVASAQSCANDWHCGVGGHWQASTDCGCNAFGADGTSLSNPFLREGCHPPGLEICREVFNNSSPSLQSPTTPPVDGPITDTNSDYVEDYEGCPAGYIRMPADTVEVSGNGVSVGGATGNHQPGKPWIWTELNQKVGICFDLPDEYTYDRISAGMINENSCTGISAHKKLYSVDHPHIVFDGPGTTQSTLYLWDSIFGKMPGGTYIYEVTVNHEHSAGCGTNPWFSQGEVPGDTTRSPHNFGFSAKADSATNNGEIGDGGVLGGDRVRLIQINPNSEFSFNVYNSPESVKALTYRGPDQTGVVGTVPKLTEGTVLSPFVVRAQRYVYHVAFDNGVTGWVDFKAIEEVSSSGGSGSPLSPPINSELRRVDESSSANSSMTCNPQAEVYDIQFGGCWHGVFMGPQCFLLFPPAPAGWSAPPACPHGVTTEQPSYEFPPDIEVPDIVEQQGGLVPPPAILPSPPTDPSPHVVSDDSQSFFQIGSRVVVNTGREANLNVRAAAGIDQVRRGSQSHNTQGVVIAGPEDASGLTWWEVNFDNSAIDGWVAGEFLVLLSGELGVSDGSCVEVNDSTGRTSVRWSPEVNNELATQSNGSRGTIIDGPVSHEGENWLEVDFNQLRDGWVRESSLRGCIGPDPFIEPPLTDEARGIIGIDGAGQWAEVTEEPAPVYDAPNGNIVAYEREGNIGVVKNAGLRDPNDPRPGHYKFVEVNGEKWYNIVFESRAEGWVERKYLRTARPRYRCENGLIPQSYPDDAYKESFAEFWLRDQGSLEFEAAKDGKPAPKYEYCLPLRAPFFDNDLEITSVRFTGHNTPTFQCANLKAQIVQSFPPYHASPVHEGGSVFPVIELTNASLANSPNDPRVFNCPECIKRGEYRVLLENVYSTLPHAHRDDEDLSGGNGANYCNEWTIIWNVGYRKDPNWPTVPGVVSVDSNQIGREDPYANTFEGFKSVLDSIELYLNDLQ